MTRAEANRGAAVYHTLVALLLLLLGGGILALGIWLHVSEVDSPLDLDFTTSNVVNGALAARVSLLVLGGVFIVTAITSLIALGRRCVGKTFRVIYVVLALAVFLLLAAVAVLTWYAYAKREAPQLRGFLREAWDRTVDRDSPAVCRIERIFKCRGFKDPQCRDEKCARCNETVVPASPCYTAIIADLRKVFLALACVSTIMAVLVLIDLFVVCAL